MCKNFVWVSFALIKFYFELITTGIVTQLCYKNDRYRFIWLLLKSKVIESKNMTKNIENTDFGLNPIASEYDIDRITVIKDLSMGQKWYKNHTNNPPLII